MAFQAYHVLPAFLFLFMLLSATTTKANLSSTFYDKTCPKALSTIRTSIRAGISRERRMAASLIRLHFHDCFVKGCDGSILLNDTANNEREVIFNKNSARGYELIDNAKTEVEKICPGVVSCADILAVAARDASVPVSGPSWTVKLGRRDSTTPHPDVALSDLPRFTESLPELIARFERKGLSERDMVALSGSHSIGQAQCFTFRNRIYNGSNIDAGFASTRRRGCPLASSESGNKKLAPLELVTPNQMDNNYFKNLLQKKGLLQSDQVLFSGGPTDSIVSEYSRNPSTFLADFASAMVKMGDIEPLTGSAGQIRRICHTVN